MLMKENIDNKIIEIINKIKPLLNNDGGDIKFIKYEDHIVYVKLLGTCADCIMSDNTINDMIEYTLKFEIPEIDKVINVL